MKEHTNTNHVELIEVLETTKLKIIISGFVKKSKNETKPFTCGECGQNVEENFNLKEHTNTNQMDLIEVLENLTLKINVDNNGKFVKKSENETNHFSL